MPKSSTRYFLRLLAPQDFESVSALSAKVYNPSQAWQIAQLQSQLEHFPQGQMVVEDKKRMRIVAYSASLIVSWDDYDSDMPWREVTDRGRFTNHDPRGKTLYGAEVIVSPRLQGKGIGRMIYEARRALCQGLGLLRIRAGARPRGYHKFANQCSIEEYLLKVAKAEVYDPTLSFQLKHGFQILGATEDYLGDDDETKGFAASIEWLNPLLAKDEDYARQKKSPYYVENYRFKKNTNKS